MVCLGTFDFWFLSFDLAGNLMWQNCYGGDSGNLANGLILLPDGTILLNVISHLGFSSCNLSSIEMVECSEKRSKKKSHEQTS
jgi:hypothetical protein